MKMLNNRLKMQEENKDKKLKNNKLIVSNKIINNHQKRI
jgi:hypothetical protein